MMDKKTLSNHTPDNHFSKLGEWERREERKEATRKKIEATIKRQRFSFRPYVATSVTVVLFAILLISFLPVLNNSELGQSQVTEEKIKMEGKLIEEYFMVEPTQLINRQVLIARVYETQREMNFGSNFFKKIGDVTVQYEKIELTNRDKLNMAFHFEGVTYTIQYFLDENNDEQEAFQFAEEVINKVKSKEM
ncbi:hypothetical protein [Bacillus sp. FJAT-45066]|uniref:hypothetical protein n=1 Tax=Bacillus sp. FJAT-45066 TaxID=2011010 RepID=UPI001141CC3A|nr:hypothetical protein [Bacillus sp. FJAT-45066]